MPSPRRFAARSLSMWAAIVAALLLGPLSTPAEASAADLESCFLSGINAQRAAAGAGALASYGPLTTYGRSHSEAMAAEGDIYHSAPSSLNPHLPQGWESWGENVGMASDSSSCQPLLDAFLASPNHRANLLDPSFDIAGIGVFIDANGAMWTTHVFVAMAAPATTTTTTTTASTATTTTTAATTTSSTATTTTTARTTTSVTTSTVAASSSPVIPAASPDDATPTTEVAAPPSTADPGDDASTTTTTTMAASTDGGTGAAPDDGPREGSDPPQAADAAPGPRCDTASCR
ncbi:MAG: CAP domain-containing protein, partial [Acidimicrobiia bacterium]|nr:CAP domain-containing protein [Acidimicrobiia bacterium]